MATKTNVVKLPGTAKVIGERVYNQARETKGCWLYEWANPPTGTPDWARKWYILKADFPANPGPTIKVTMSV
jgi:hypothetical protein